MRISSKGEYGLRALFDLAQRYGEGPIQSHDIHQRQGVDENYLNQILIVLRKAGLIESVRGPQGGHRLARPPAQITLLEALVALEGPLLPAESGRDGSTPVEPIDRVPRMLQARELTDGLPFADPVEAESEPA